MSYGYNTLLQFELTRVSRFRGFTPDRHRDSAPEPTIVPCSKFLATPLVIQNSTTVGPYIITIIMSRLPKLTQSYDKHTVAYLEI